jgi:hypothetical protein
MLEYNLRGTIKNIQEAIEEGVLDQLPASDRKKNVRNNCLHFIRASW